MERYEKYKDSGIEWIGEIPEHWEINKLKSLVSLNDEVLSEKTDEDTLIDYIEIGDLKNGNISSTEYPFGKAPSRARRIVRTGDVIVSTVRTYLKAIAQIPKKNDGYIASTGFAVLRPQKIDSGYLGYYSISPFFIDSTIANSVGVTYPAINAPTILDFPIQLPPPKEQSIIARYLDRKTVEIDELIADKKRLLELYEEEKITIINQAVTKGINPNVPMKDSGIEWLGEIPEHWEIEKLKSISTYFKGMAFKSQDFVMNGIPIVKASNIKELTIKNITSFIDETNQKPEFEKVRLFTGDIVVSTVGSKPDVVNSAVGQLAYVSEEYSNSYLNQNTICIRAIEKVQKEYLKYLLLSKYMRAKIDSIALWIANQAYIEIEKLRGTFVSLPDLEEQNLIIEFINTSLEKINCKKEKTQKLIDLLIEYRTALISEVVTGKIKVTE